MRDGLSHTILSNFTDEYDVDFILFNRLYDDCDVFNSFKSHKNFKWSSKCCCIVNGIRIFSFRRINDDICNILLVTIHKNEVII